MLRFLSPKIFIICRAATGCSCKGRLSDTPEKVPEVKVRDGAVEENDDEICDCRNSCRANK